MRIIAEWWDPGGRYSTCMFHRCEAFEGETVEEINAAIKARAGNAEVVITGLRNTRENFEIYTGQPTKLEHAFADTVFETPPAAALKGWFARLSQRFLAWAGY